jgi:hypothetical protein
MVEPPEVRTRWRYGDAWDRIPVAPGDVWAAGPHVDLDDGKTPRVAIDAFTEPGDVMLDPCLGRGLTAISANAAGRVCVGLELNPRRLAVAIDLLRAPTQWGEPRRVGRLE